MVIFVRELGVVIPLRMCRRMLIKCLLSLRHEYNNYENRLQAAFFKKHQLIYWPNFLGRKKMRIHWKLKYCGSTLKNTQGKILQVPDTVNVDNFACVNVRKMPPV